MGLVSKVFWDNIRPFGFRTGLYDLLTPVIYDDMLIRLVEAADLAEGETVVDVGCRSGRLLEHLRGPLAMLRCRYTGIGKSRPGIEEARRRIDRLALSEYAKAREAQYSDVIPLATASQDVAFSHFSLYSLPTASARQRTLREMRRVLRPGGRLLVAWPGPHYNGDQIIEASREARERSHYTTARRRAFDERIGFKILKSFEDGVGRRIREGAYGGHTAESLRAEVEAAGFEVDWVRSDYGGTAYTLRAVVADGSARREAADASTPAKTPDEENSVITIVHKIRLRPDASPEAFESWVKNSDYATCPDLPSLVSFAVHRIDAPADAPAHYFEIICIDSVEAFEKDMQTPQFGKLVEAFDKMAEVVEEITGERIEPGYRRAGG